MPFSYVYIMASDKRGTIYVGVTSDLMRRVYEHKNDLVDGFTSEYRTHKLVHFEIFEDIRYAIHREKRLKKWNRQWKVDLIEETNPEWKDLSDSLFG